MKGFYELVLIQKKSMKLLDYKKRAEKFDQDSENLSVEKVEEKFWRSLSFNPPIYGADVKGTLFDKNLPWNLAELHTILNDGLGCSKIYGINEPYFYFGSWRTTFAWHCEDLNLPSINFLHYGKPKFWYVIGRNHGKTLEELAKKYFADSFSKCPEHMRHKTTLINPYILQKLCPDIVCHKTVHNPGEFIITFPGCYHAGFNWGFNIAEAVNFGVNHWLDVFPYCNVCQCQSDNVNINPIEFYRNLIKRNPKLKVSPITKVLRAHIKDIGENLDNLHLQIETARKYEDEIMENGEITDQEAYAEWIESQVTTAPAISGGRKMARYSLVASDENGETPAPEDGDNGVLGVKPRKTSKGEKVKKEKK